MEPTEKKLKAILFRFFCPTQMELGEFELELLEGPQHEEIASHVDSCPHCQKDLIQIRKTINLPFVQKAEPIIHPEQTSSLADQVKVFVVNLFSPSPDVLIGPSLQPALRGQDDEMKTQVVHIGSFIVSLSFERDLSQLGRYHLVGDVSADEGLDEPIGFYNWKAYLWQAGVLVQTVALDEEGDFTFEGISLEDKPYNLIIGDSAVEIHLQHLQFPDSSGEEGGPS